MQWPHSGGDEVNPAIYQWAMRHHVGLDAINELKLLFGTIPDTVLTERLIGELGTEARVQSEAQLQASVQGNKLWRNNVGALTDERKRLVRFGLANDSKQLNEHLKSSDLIGWKRKLITPEMLGTHIAQFYCRECKPVNWQYTGEGREPAQLRWIELVNASGGDAAFCTGIGNL